MGLYDTITFKREPKGTFQTKSLECYLIRYAVEADGRLMRLSAHDGNELDEPVHEDYTGEIVFEGYVAWCVHGVVKEVICIRPAEYQQCPESP